MREGTAEPKGKVTVSLAAQERFFTDHNGKVHHIPDRTPAASAEEWKAGLTPDQMDAIATWSYATSFNPFKNTMHGKDEGQISEVNQWHDGKPHAAERTWEDATDDVNAAIMKA